jgi:hypothetical protein
MSVGGIGFIAPGMLTPRGRRGETKLNPETQPSITAAVRMKGSGIQML